MKLTHAFLTVLFALGVSVSAGPSVAESVGPDAIAEYLASGGEDVDVDKSTLAKRGNRVSVKQKYFPWSPDVGGPHPDEPQVDDGFDESELEKRGTRINAKSKYFPWTPDVGGPRAEAVVDVDGNGDQ